MSAPFGCTESSPRDKSRICTFFQCSTQPARSNFWPSGSTPTNIGARRCSTSVQCLSRMACHMERSCCSAPGALSQVLFFGSFQAVQPRHRNSGRRSANREVRFISCILLKSYSFGKLLPSQPRAPPPHCAQKPRSMGTPAAALHMRFILIATLPLRSQYSCDEIFRKNKGRNKCIIRCVPEVRSGKTAPLLIELVAEDFFLRCLCLSLRSSRSNRA